MLKKTLSYFFAAFLLTIVSVPAQGRGLWFPNNRQVHNTIWEGKLKREVGFLTDSICAGRASGTSGNAAAAFWICSKFERAGLLPFGKGYVQSFAIDTVKVGHNILGMLPGSKKDARNSYIIVGAHYDHIGVLNGKLYPGADRNASGTVAMLSIADMFSFAKVLGRSFEHNIIFVAFDGKEHSMAGSEFLARTISSGNLIDPISGKPILLEQIDLMVNIDQIGGSKSITSGREDFLIMLGREKLHAKDRDLLSYCNRTYGINLELSYTYFGSRNFTDMFYNRLADQKPFIDAGVRSVFFTSGITMNNNKPYDNAESLNYEVLKKRIILIWQWISSLS